jgi:N-succinyldiaminopimelate aminotransferase
MPDIPHRWSAFGTSIFSLMTQAANKYGAVNLAQGFPNFDGPDEIKEAAITAIRGTSNQYAPSAGLPRLRQLLAERMRETSGLNYDAEHEVTVFSGATEALFCSFQAFFKPHDEIITFAPFFDCYPAGAFSAGAKLVEVQLKTPDWTFGAEDLDAKLTKNTKAILINTPHNPTGRVFSRSELEILANFARKNDLLVITDEVYDSLVYDGLEHVTLASLPGMRERTVVISSTAKTFSFTGWKVGYAFAPKRLTDELRGVHQFTVFCSATPLQVGMCRALEFGNDYYKRLRQEYTERRDTLCNGLQKLGYKFRVPQGTYFVVADYSHVSTLPDFEFYMWLTDFKKVAVIPSCVFYEKPSSVRSRQFLVRFAYCKDLATIKEGLDYLSRL